MNSEYGKKFSLDEITEMNRPTVKSVMIPEEELKKISDALIQMRRLTKDLCREKQALESTAKDLREAVKKSTWTMSETYKELVGKAYENAASAIKERRIMNAILLGLQLVCTAALSVLLLTVYMGWLR